MTIRVLFFSVLQDFAGGAEIEEILDDSREWRISDLLERLYERHEAMREWDRQLLVAIDCAYAERDTLLQDGQEIAIMPPVQGGVT